MANGPYYYFMVGLPYHQIILDNIEQFESLSIVHTDSIACVAFPWSVIGWNLHNRCDSRTFDRTKLNMFNPCDPERNCCRMYGCTCSCSCMYVYTARSSRRSHRVNTPLDAHRPLRPAAWRPTTAPSQPRPLPSVARFTTHRPRAASGS